MTWGSSLFRMKLRGGNIDQKKKGLKRKIDAIRLKA